MLVKLTPINYPNFSRTPFISDFFLHRIFYSSDLDIIRLTLSTSNDINKKLFCPSTKVCKRLKSKVGEIYEKVEWSMVENDVDNNLFLFDYKRRLIWKV